MYMPKRSFQFTVCILYKTSGFAAGELTFFSEHSWNSVFQQTGSGHEYIYTTINSIILTFKH